ncbi:MAG: hypothetical protein KF838_02750 [Phycisphaeraceae bacterium]|nr:MAG: hypothetical protein KF838_02750 [Phycisphaeraceae bacterium]
MADARGGESASVGAFGKHPAWNDHIEDIGLESERLVFAKRSIYIEGIGGNIDSGAWDGLEESARVDGFDHTLLWSFENEWLLGRMWSSSDGKGRTKYPMSIVAHARHVPVEVATDAISIIENAEAKCKTTSDRQAVIDALAAARAAFRELAAKDHADASHQADLSPLITSSDLGPDLVGLERVFYQIHRDMSAYLKGTDAEGTTSRIKSVDLRPQHIRVPACIEGTLPSLLAWRDLLGELLDVACPILVIRRGGSPWIDIIIGAPGVAQFFCLRAGPTAVPPATVVPYTIDPELSERVRRWAAGRQGP